MGESVLDNVRKEFAAGDSARSASRAVDVSLDCDRQPPPLRGGEVVVGIRPERFEDAAFAAPGLRRALDPSRLYYFSPETGPSLLERP